MLQTLLTQFGNDNMGTLGVNLNSLIIQLITFVIVILVIKKWAVKPIVKMLDERREKIEKGLSLGEKMEKEEAEMEKKVAKALRDARKQADDIIGDAGERGHQLVAEAESDAKKKSELIIASAEDRAKQEMAEARQKMEAEIATLVTEAAETIIDEKIDTKKDASLLENALKQASEGVSQ